MEYQYDVFLSYRHKPLDSIITQKTFHMVESFRLPRALQSRGHEIRRAFRDTEELSVSRILTDTIDKALHSSNCLLLVCSVDTPSSEWVDREVAMFIELGRADKIYPLLISGDPETSFPPSAKRIPDIMDRVMDVRCPDNDPKKIAAKEDMALLKVLAAATGTDYRQLRAEHSQRRIRQFVGKAAAAAAVFALVGAVSLGLMQKARTYRQEAQTAEKASMAILQELTYGLPDRLSGVPGAYSRIAGILQDNAGQISRILLLSTDKTAAGLEVAANCERLATAMTVLGDYDSALESQHKAIDGYRELAPDNTAVMASALNNLGKIYSRQGQYDAARDAFTQALQLQQQTDDPVTLGTILGNLGAVCIQSGDNAQALQYLDSALQVLEAQDASDYNMLSARANAGTNYGTLLYRKGEYGLAQTALLQGTLDWQSLCDLVDSPQNRTGLVSAAATLAACCADMGEYDRALEYYESAAVIARDLADDRENTEALSALAGLCNNMALCCNIQNDYAAADSRYREAAGLYRELWERSGAAADGAVYATACLNTGENAFKAGTYTQSREAFEEGLRVYGSVCGQLGDYYSAMYHTWQAYYTLIHVRDYEQALDYAIAAYELQPDNVLVNLNLAYACLYAGYEEDCDALIALVASLGEGQAQTIRMDIAAQQRAGLYSPHTEAVLALVQ